MHLFQENVSRHETMEKESVQQDKTTNNCDDVQNITTDIGAWPENVSQSFRDLMVNTGTEFLQNRDGPFLPDESGRSLQKTWFQRLHTNGERTERTWMCYSISKKSLFCFCCTLFPQKNDQSSFSSKTGFSTWKKLNPRIQDHENSPAHRSSFLEWKDLERSMRNGGLIDNRLQQLIREETKVWRDILERIIATIHTLAQQNLALRGHRESITKDSNPGNFIALIKYLSKFDPVMKAHVESVSANSRHLSYFSHDIQNEIINLLGNNVRRSITSEIKKAIYYSISFDTTPDSSHEEQMSEIIRYVEVKRNSVEIKESFIDFINVKKKDAASMTEEILEKLEVDGLDLYNCRGQSYDNQATMAGVHSGVQQRILDRNPLAVFVPCNNHSLNLVGVHAANVNPQAITFFGTVERIYAFFSKSTHRWDVLKEFVKITVKCQSDTRWSANAEAVHSLSTQLDGVLLALEKLRDTPTETVNTRQDAALVIGAIERFDFIVLLLFWADILPTINKMQKMFQTVEISFEESLTLLETLQDHLKEWRANLSDSVILKAKKLCEEMGVTVEKRRRKIRKMPGELVDDAALDVYEKTKSFLVEILDKLTVEISDRFSSLRELRKRFGFLCTFEEYLVNDTKAYNEKLMFVERKCNFLAEVYSNDFNGKELYDDIKDVLFLFKRARKNGEKLDLSPRGILLYISSLGLEAYKALVTALKFFLTLPLSVASCERSFSKLKLIKSYLRSTMSQDRLSNLAILSIENKVATSINYDHIINEFAEAKARKVKL